MPRFRFHHPVEVRYVDIDAQGHVNNAKYLTYFEQARVAYLKHLGIWDGENFMDAGIILANARVDFKRPVRLNQDVQVGVRVSHLGNKSITMDYRLEDRRDSQHLLAEGSTVLVSFDYRMQTTIPVPEEWREAITQFEKLENV